MLIVRKLSIGELKKLRQLFSIINDKEFVIFHSGRIYLDENSKYEMSPLYIFLINKRKVSGKIIIILLNNDLIKPLKQNTYNMNAGTNNSTSGRNNVAIAINIELFQISYISLFLIK